MHAVVASGHGTWIGLHTGGAALDTGPSVVVTAVALAIAFEARTPRLGTILVALLVGEWIVARDLSAVEHLVGLVAGSFVWWASRSTAQFANAGRFSGRLQRHRRAVRRVTAGTVGVMGALAVTSALRAPHRGSHGRELHLLPVGVAHVANGVVAAAGVLLLVLSRGLLRGQRRAWLLSVSLVSVVAASTLARGHHLVAASVSLGVLVLLVSAQQSFTARSDRRASMVALRSTVVMLAIAFAAAVVAVVALTRYSRHQPRLAVGTAARVVLDALFGWKRQPMNERAAGFLHAGVFGAAAVIAALGLWQALRPVLSQRRDAEERLAAARRARDILARFGGGTLDYFVLRDDKDLFFSGDTVVGYMVTLGVCLVSPDPIGPPGERERAWAEFRAFTDRQGWTVAVLAAGTEWLPIYGRYGMRVVYAGDEGVVDSGTFHLDGGERKSLRQAVNRIDRHGYTVTFHDPASAEPALRASIEELMSKSRRGGVERGFSMTLGRIFDPADTGMLLAVCSAPDGRPAAFCQYAPAPSIGGWSLDLMRRDPADHPNGLLDFVIVQTIRHVAEQGGGGVGLNFATMRALLAADGDLGPLQRVQRWVLQHLSDSMQITSLWHFNAKYGPRWIPRHIVVDGAENMVHVATAIARAESMWELPVIGRWFGGRSNEPTPARATAP